VKTNKGRRLCLLFFYLLFLCPPTVVKQETPKVKRRTDNFQKFIHPKRNAAIKEQFKQDKKTARKERKEAIEKHFEKKRKGAEARSQPPGTGKSPLKPEKTELPRMPLNKFIAHCGICSRRDAALLVKEGRVKVNGQEVSEPGTRVSATDLVLLNGKRIRPSLHFTYILLNKPKDYLTTTEDPEKRKTVLDLLGDATQERIYPVGRLDRNTSGLLLLTNDGDLAQKLAHPSFGARKVYHVSLDKSLSAPDFSRIQKGIVLEDGLATVDAIAYPEPGDTSQVGLEIHSGKNRIVRRIFEQLGYQIRSLDRVIYAGLTKKNLPRGKWRLLTEREVRLLKYMNASAG
jgi:23S rRNA pseudouridine2605 synthase